MDNTSLAALLTATATTLGVERDELQLQFESDRGTFIWWCKLAAKRVKHGRGFRLVRSEVCRHGETPELAAAELIRSEMLVR